LSKVVISAFICIVKRPFSTTHGNNSTINSNSNSRTQWSTIVSIGLITFIGVATLFAMAWNSFSSGQIIVLDSSTPKQTATFGMFGVSYFHGDDIKATTDLYACHGSNNNISKQTQTSKWM
jgi:hypothetical protein